MFLQISYSKREWFLAINCTLNGQKSFILIGGPEILKFLSKTIFCGAVHIKFLSAMNMSICNTKVCSKSRVSKNITSTMNKL